MKYIFISLRSNPVVQHHKLCRVRWTKQTEEDATCSLIKDGIFCSLFLYNESGTAWSVTDFTLPEHSASGYILF
jgi:hypothetical protein